jgi:hypothetical protein
MVQALWDNTEGFGIQDQRAGKELANSVILQHGVATGSV